MDVAVKQGQGAKGQELSGFRESRLCPWLMAGMDAGSIGMVVFLAAAIRHGMEPWFPISLSLQTLLGIYAAALLLPVGYATAGLYPGYGLTEVERLRKRSTVTMAAFGLLAAFDYFAQGGQWSRGVLVVAASLSLLVLPLCDSAFRALLLRRRMWGLPVLLCGALAQRQALQAAMIANPILGYVPVGHGDWPLQMGTVPPDVSTIVVAEPPGGVTLGRVLDELPFRRVIVVPDFGDWQSQWVSVRELGAQLGLELRRNLLIASNMVMKRGMDLALALLLGIPAIPLIAVSALAVKLASPGPVFYGQLREGRGGRMFRMWKIRTMVADAEDRLEDLINQSEESGREWRHHMKLQADPRIIPRIGRFLRRWSIDELPQLWNVLIGEMSISGPRPLPRYHLEVLSQDIYRLRSKVRPGITGLWQVSGRGILCLNRQEELDAYYVRNWSLWLDIYILARTTGEVVSGRGSY